MLFYDFFKIFLVCRLKPILFKIKKINKRKKNILNKIFKIFVGNDVQEILAIN